jgi:hypothetical protein
MTLRNVGIEAKSVLFTLAFILPVRKQIHSKRTIVFQINIGLVERRGLFYFSSGPLISFG